MNQVITSSAGPRDPLVFRPIVEEGPELRAQLRVLETEGTDFLMRLHIRPPADVVREAEAVLVQIDAACMSGSRAKDNPATVEAWLTKLNAGQVKPLPQMSLQQVMLPAVLVASGDLPQRCFSYETLGEALRTLRFVGAHQVHVLLAPVGQALYDRRAMLKAVVRAGNASERARSAIDLDQGQREAILADFRAKLALVGEGDAPSLAVRPVRDLPPLPTAPQDILARARDRVARARAGGGDVGYFERVLAGLEAKYQGVA